MNWITGSRTTPTAHTIGSDVDWIVPRSKAIARVSNGLLVVNDARYATFSEVRTFLRGWRLDRPYCSMPNHVRMRLARYWSLQFAMRSHPSAQRQQWSHPKTQRKRTRSMAWYAIPSIGRSFSSSKGLGEVNWVWRKTTEPSSVALQLHWRRLFPPIHSTVIQLDSYGIRLIKKCIPAEMSLYTLIACEELEVKDR